MRKLNATYKVSYDLKDENGVVILSKINSACYAELYRIDSISKKHKLILSDFLCEETFDYHKIYIRKICNIFGLKVKYNRDNEIEVTGFEKVTILKVFLAMFRILFEIYSDYPGDAGNLHKERTVSFMKDFCKYRIKGPSADDLKRFCYFYNLNRIYGGSGHGLTEDSDHNVHLLTKSDINKRSNSKGVQSFFKEEN